MTHLGTVRQLLQRETYVKTVITEELGYKTETYTARISKLLIPVDFEENCQVLFTGRHRTRDGISQFQVETITVQDFPSCTKCSFPLTSFVCPIKHDSEMQRIDSVWQVRQKVLSGLNIRIFFMKNNRFVFGVEVTSKQWFYDRILELNEGDFVRVEGWYGKQTNLSFVEKSESVDI
jgi:hypothetical protein